MRQHVTVARVAEALGVSWNAANTAVIAEGKRMLIDDRGRFDGVTVIVSPNTCGVTPAAATNTSPSIIDLTAVRKGIGRARLLDMVEGRSKQAFETWRADRPTVLARRGGHRRHGRPFRVQDRHAPKSCPTRWR